MSQTQNCQWITGLYDNGKGIREKSIHPANLCQSWVGDCAVWPSRVQPLVVHKLLCPSILLSEAAPHTPPDWATWDAKTLESLFQWSEADVTGLHWGGCVERLTWGWSCSSGPGCGPWGLDPDSPSSACWWLAETALGLKWHRNTGRHRPVSSGLCLLWHTLLPSHWTGLIHPHPVTSPWDRKRERGEAEWDRKRRKEENGIRWTKHGQDTEKTVCYVSMTMKKPKHGPGLTTWVPEEENQTPL